MLKYTIKRICMAPILVLLATLLIFLLVNITPTDPTYQLLPSVYTQEQYDELREELGLDDPLLVQYGNYIWNCLHGDFGYSWASRKNVWEDVAPRIPVSVKISVITLIATIIVCTPLGVACAVKQYTWVDTVINLLSKLLGSIPGFWVAMIGMLVFSQKLHWLPTYGIDTWKHYILPVATLLLTSGAVYLRQTRSSMLDCIRQFYIRTARSNGATEKIVIYRDALKNALLPLVTMMGGQLAATIGSGLVIENVFSIPGLGSRCITAVYNKDIPALLACVIFLAIFFAIITLIIDLLYTVIDPRVRSAFVGGKKKKKAKAVAKAEV